MQQTCMSLFVVVAFSARHEWSGKKKLTTSLCATYKSSIVLVVLEEYSSLYSLLVSKV